ncbi:MAG TPA: hypothetical protein VIB11_04950 [Pedococcus sp.]|jgi:hypothetical protein|uniref:hypothetical protein n=1 Tax=Pedococcus sp. TaxID=2860345 RepID=UPI002F951243
MAQTRIDIIDETYIRASPEAIRAYFDDGAVRARLWPHLTLELVRDRGLKGQRWKVGGHIAGEMEVWIEPFWDGAIVHHYVRGEATRAAPRDVSSRHRLRWKRAVHSLKDCLEHPSG